jgi:lipopolysaccharide biosynthesis glycosyltransferase
MSDKPVVFLGWDDREKIAYEVCKHSIEMHTTSKPKIIPLYHKELRRQGLFQRPWLTEALTGNTMDLIDGRPFSTQFSHTRFLVPEIMNYKGWALFMDCDMIVRNDIKEVFDFCDDKYAVMVVKHRQNVTKSEKMDGSPQQSYYRKNWSSFVLWNCNHPKNKHITKELVNTATGGWLHAFSWLNDDEIGSLPEYYNWIEGSSPGNMHPQIIHYTTGGPWFDGHKDVMFGDQWWTYYESFHKNLPEPAAQLSRVDYKNL